MTERDIPDDWFEEESMQRLVLNTDKVRALYRAALLAHHEMRHTVAPRDSFTDALDALDAALCGNAEERQ
jgi:hypothetical protein